MTAELKEFLERCNMTLENFEYEPVDSRDMRHFVMEARDITVKIIKEMEKK